MMPGEWCNPNCIYVIGAYGVGILVVTGVLLGVIGEAMKGMNAGHHALVVSLLALMIAVMAYYGIR